MKNTWQFTKPTTKCAMCLWKLGLGYNRIAKLLRCSRSISKYIQLRIKRGYSRQLISKILPPPKPKRVIDREAKLQKSLDNRRELRRRKMLRRNVWKFLFVFKNSPTMEGIVGCSRVVLRAHLALQFKAGMSWDNYGSYWEIDHVVPCKAFQLSKPDEVRRCFHFSNMRPEYRRKNRSKAAKIITSQPELLITGLTYIPRQAVTQSPAPDRPLPTLKTGTTGSDQQHATSGQNQPYAHDRPSVSIKATA